MDDFSRLIERLSHQLLHQYEPKKNQKRLQKGKDIRQTTLKCEG